VLVSPGLMDKVVSCEHFYSTPPKWCAFSRVMTATPSLHLPMSSASASECKRVITFTMLPAGATMQASC
jgi:hypothetical protein